MILLVRRIATLCVIGAALAACGAPGTSRRPAPLSAPPPAPPSSAARQPALAPGPEGPTPVFTRAATREKVVALTFDVDRDANEGPRGAAGGHVDIPGLIEALRSLKVPATVFMTGRWADENPREARAIGRDPLFEVANHSYSHSSFAGHCHGLPVLPAEKIRSDAERAFTAIRKAGVPRPMPYFRFPGGCYDDRALRAIASLGVTAVQWDVAAGAASATDADAAVRQVLDGVRPGSVVVVHRTGSAAPVGEQVIRAVVPELRGQGYRFVKVSELIGASGGRS
ncbi:polysaccharide deacetylase family protein [Streptomyces chiangmaiensis]|uniref:Polysaccharide deacetylase family protein n=1 Tax=Streptomyces chiangmaiensis TaxID=766497 RepID=A0ABU7FAK2_9ACTN|nr:polysaccharide deacetylase family protein [Streptomyces chiangmaiensis]MED7820996.1 polysaccharide deacetylase family protein [Streptomyces chiangmaiensis]